MKTARDCLSNRVVTVHPDQHLIDVVAAVVRQDALYCAVVTRSGNFLGLVRLKEIVLRSADRIFADLVPAIPPMSVDEAVEAETIVKLLRSHRCDEVVVLTKEKQYVGLVTRESLFDWWVRAEKKDAAGK
jgi:CBS-domain-containing membrane protein